MTIEEMRNKYDMTIGIECHVQLATDTKLFSAANNDARDKSPNSTVSPIDFGLPGMLPVLNRRAVDLAIRAGKALNAPIARVSRFDRKHYFYPDLPKGYQTTQMYHPIILAGHVDAPLDDGTTVRVRIHHAHMEEDAGKLTHYSDHSLVDLNRAGTPLIEVVSEPDIHSAQAARAFASELHRLMVFSGVTRGDLYHGNMRFDVNLSVALKGATELGTRAEVKNLNSFRSIEKAAEYEFRRQVEIVESGKQVVQETRGWDEDKQMTNSQRSKEDAQDYRYMPDADIPPIVLTDEEIERIQSEVSMLPSEYRELFAELKVDSSVIGVLLAEQLATKLMHQMMQKEGSGFAQSRVVANLLSSIKLTDEDEDSDTATGSSVKILIEEHAAKHGDDALASDLLSLAGMFSAQEVSSNAMAEIFSAIMHGATNPRAVAEAKDLLQMSDESAVIAVVEEVLADPASERSIEDIKAGKDKAIGYLVGQVMKKSQGKANPAMAQKMIRERL